MIQLLARAVLTVALTLPCFALPLAQPNAQEGEPADARPNVLLVTLEAVRTDRLGLYGREESVTPRLDALGAEGAVFEGAYAHAPLVLPAIASVMTGVTPLAHGLHEDTRLALGPELPTLAETLGAQGYRTAAFQGSLELAAPFGLGRGFELYDATMGAASDMKALARERRARFVVGAFLDWIKNDPSETPFFAWLHLPDARLPYEPPVDLRSVPDPYDGELAAIDRELGRLLDDLAELGKLDNTIVIVVGAMGEALGDQGEDTHGLLLQESVMHVPMIVRLPGSEDDGLRITSPAGQSDVMPTVLGLTGTAPGPSPLKEFAGENLAGVVNGGDGPAPDERSVYLESEAAARQLGWSTLRGLVRGSKKLVVGSSPQLFDVLADPTEEHDLAAEEAQLVESMSAELAALLTQAAELQPSLTRPRGREVDRLAALTYEVPDALHGGPLPERGAADPRARVEAWNAYQDAYQTAWAGRPHELGPPLERALAASPDTPMLLALVAVAYERSRRFEDAVDYLNQAIASDPELALAYYQLARAHLSTGQPGEAESYFLLTIELDPTHELALRSMGRRMAETGRMEDAQPYFAALSELRPDDRMVWNALAQISRNIRDWSGAIEALDGAVLNFPEDLGMRNLLAWTLAAAPDAEVRDPERAIEIASALRTETGGNDPGILDTLAIAYASAGQYDEAVRIAGEGISVANSRRLKQVVEGLRARLALYQQQTPYFDQ